MAFSYYRTITIDNTKVDADLTNFPLLVSGTYTYLKTVANGGLVTNANGYDIRFYSDSALTTALDFEVSRYVATTGEFVAWVKVPSVANSTDTVIYMAYTDATISTDQSTRTAVWASDTALVAHIDNTTLNGLDSTSNNNTPTFNGGATLVTGKVGGGVGLASASSQNLIYSSAANITAVGTNGCTMSLWLNPSTLDGLRPLIENGNSSNFGVHLWNYSTGGQIYVNYKSTGGTDNAISSTSTTLLQTSTWQHVAFTYNRSTGAVAIYYNGTAVSLTTSNIGTNIAGQFGYNLNVGYRPNGATYYNGSIDEVRLIDAVRSADWIKAEYNNQNSPSTFYTVGSEVPTSVPATMTGIGSISGLGSITF